MSVSNKLPIEKVAGSIPAGHPPRSDVYAVLNGSFRAERIERGWVAGSEPTSPLGFGSRTCGPVAPAATRVWFQLKPHLSDQTSVIRDPYSIRLPRIQEQGNATAP